MAGVEIADSARSALSAAGIAAYASLADVPAEEKFGAMRMNWSLEHVHAPSEYFRFIASRLAPGGRAVIAVPNYGGVLYRLSPDCVEVPVHLYHFGVADIRAYAHKYGLRVREAQTFSYPQMFVAAAAVDLLPAAFGGFARFADARALARALRILDGVGLGNDMIVVLESGPEAMPQAATAPDSLTPA